MRTYSFIILLLALTSSSYAQSKGTYIGCFNDNTQQVSRYGGLRDLPFLYDEGYNGDMTPPICVDACADRGYFYAGLQAGRQCFCGNTYGQFCVTSESRCGSCIASNAYECGSSNVNSVFVAKEGGPGQNRTCTCGDSNTANCGQTTGTYLGCYNDDYFGNSTSTATTNRDLPVGMEPYGILPSECVQKCVDGGYYYAGIQAGGECWCGNERYGSFCAATSDNCGRRCQRDSSQYCGGDNFNALYVAKPGGPGRNSTCACGNPGKCINVPTPPTPLQVSAVINSYGCATSTYSLSYTVSATGGVAPYLYKINNGIFSANTVYNRYKQGNITITSIDSKGTMGSTVFFVGPATAITVSAIPTESYGFAVSAAGAVDGVVTLQAQSGKAPYTYSLLPNSAADAYRAVGGADVTVNIANLAAGTYSAFVTDANGCQSTGTNVIVYNPVLPAPPTKLSVTITSSTLPVFAQASWTAPTNTGYAKILGYSVQWGFWNGTEITWGAVASVTSASATADVSPLQSTRRFVRAASVNVAGTGAYSSAYEFQSLCAAGRFADRTNCSYCPAGTSTLGTIGRTSCRSCLSGTYSTAGSATCSNCEDNTVSSYGASKCTQCSAGYVADSSYCKPCRSGTYNPSATSSTCLTCPANTYASRDGSTSCLSCAAGYTSTPGSSYCVDSSGYKK